MSKTIQQLPIDEVLEELVSTIASNPSVVLHAPTGAGKTTRVPPALSASLPEGQVLVLEPRRVAARMAARRVASERGWTLGREVGYQVRFDKKASDKTRIVYMTPGVLLRRLQTDPFVEGVAAVVFDEFHERSLQSDLALALTRQIQREVREDLCAVVMSATLQAAPIARWLDSPVVASEGRLHPIEIRYARTGGRLDYRDAAERTARGVRQVLHDTDGHVLVFMPGVREIQDVCSQLGDTGLLVRPLHGRLSLDQQEAAITPTERRKIVVSTNVAETSLTVPGVTAVVDSGLAKVMRYDLSNGLDRLELGRISRASADQRAGRAGRERPGVCYRIWTEAEHIQLAEREEPEIHRVDLSGVMLQLLCWGEQDPRQFGWFEPPGEESLNAALQLLEDLGATEDGEIVQLGRDMLEVPAHPRIARMLLEARELSCVGSAALAAAALSERVPRSASTGSSDVDSDIVEQARWIAQNQHHGRARWLQRVADQLANAVDANRRHRDRDRDDVRVRRAIFAGWPDRVAHRRDSNSDRAVMVGRRGVRLGRDSRVQKAEFFVCADVDAGRRGERSEAWVRAASRVEEQWLEERSEDRLEVYWDDDNQQVQATRQRCYRDLVLSEQSAPVPNSPQTADCLAEAASDNLEDALGLNRPALRTFLNRLRVVHEAAPGLGYPRIDESWLREILPDLCHGRRSFDELRKGPLLDHIRSSIGWDKAQKLDTLAPVSITVPSGRSRRLTWEDEGPPVLAVKIQEMFGATDTPTVVQGRVPVLLHLLAPNGRPQQVTTDLAGFWERIYPEVRKELRARYSKHPWPEDPLDANATWKTKRQL